MEMEGGEGVHSTSSADLRPWFNRLWTVLTYLLPMLAKCK